MADRTDRTDQTGKAADRMPERDESGAIAGNTTPYQGAGTTGDVGADETGVEPHGREPAAPPPGAA